MEHTVREDGYLVLTEGKRVDFVYTQSGNYTLEFYRASTDTDIVWFDLITRTDYISIFYRRRISITPGTISLFDVTCADTGVYNIVLFIGTLTVIKQFKIYPPHACETFTLNVVQGAKLWLLPFITTDVDMIWYVNGLPKPTRELIVNEVFAYDTITLVDNMDSMTVYIAIIYPYTASVKCDLINYRWYYRNIKVLNSRFFIINTYSNTITGYDVDLDNYKCQPLPLRHHWLLIYMLGAFIVGCIMISCCTIIIYECNLCCKVYCGNTEV